MANANKSPNNVLFANGGGGIARRLDADAEELGKESPLGDGEASIEIGEISNLVDVLQTVRSAVLADELDPALEAMVKPRAKNSKKPADAPKGQSGSIMRVKADEPIQRLSYWALGGILILGDYILNYTNHEKKPERSKNDIQPSWSRSANVVFGSRSDFV